MNDFSSPYSSRSPLLGSRIDMPNALPDCVWQMVQWQAKSSSISSEIR